MRFERAHWLILFAQFAAVCLTADFLAANTKEGGPLPFHSETRLISDLFSNVKGGRQRGTELFALASFAFTLDGEKLLSWKGMRFHISSWASTGGGISHLAGDCQGISNIEAPRSIRLFEAWFEQEAADGQFSIKAGLYDLNSEFDSIETAQLFLNSSHGVGAEFSQIGPAGPSIFPYSSFGLRLKTRLSENSSFKVALVEPNPPGLASDFPWLVVGEFSSRGLTSLPGQPFDLTIGGWLFTDKTTPILMHTDQLNFGFYASTDWSLDQLIGEGAKAFVRIGTASHYSNQLSSYLGSGLSLDTGWLHSEDSLGIAIALANNGNCFRRLETDYGNPGQAFELAVELTYRVRLLRQLHLQPNLQYVINPGGSRQHDPALVLGTRIEISAP